MLKLKKKHNEELIAGNYLEQLRIRTGRSFTPSSRDCADVMQWAMSDIVNAEENNFGEEDYRQRALVRSTELYKLAENAMKEAFIMEFLQNKGQIVAVA